MTKVLFLAYHFPPIGGAGVQRNGKFARYLPEFDCELTVVTGPGSANFRWTPHDPTMAADVDPRVTVHRLPGPEPSRSDGWRGRAERWLNIRSPWLNWWNDGVLEAGRRMGSSVDVVYASLVPFETAEIATRLAAELRRPLVIDLQDPWVLDEMVSYPSGLHRRLELSRMRKALRSADAIVMNTPESARRVVRAFPELRDVVVVSIPNGFDGADFNGVAPTRDPAAPFRIVHTGYLHTSMGLRQHELARIRRLIGGHVRGIDILTRSHVYLLQAIDGLLRRDPGLESRLEVHFAGVLTADDEAIAKRLPVTRLHGYLTHGDTVELMRSADLLFLPMHDAPEGHRISIVPGKTYEYLGSARPILAAVPDGDARDLLTEAGSALLCRPSDVGAMADIIAAQMRCRDAGSPEPTPDRAVLARYERRALAEQLASVLAAAAVRSDRGRVAHAEAA